MILTNSRERSRFLRFAVVGSVGAVIDFSLFNIQTSLLKVPPIVAQAFSFTVAVCSNFLWNRLWTYPDSRSKSIRYQVIQFFIVNVIGLMIRTPLIGWLGPVFISLFTRMAIPFSISSTIAGHNVALAIAVGIVMLWNFFINRYWTYSDVDVK
jgi:putative flippase GtrA